MKINSLEIVGWIGSMMFAFCALPQAWQIFLTHSTDDISWGFLAMWFIGEVMTFTYVLISDMKRSKFQWPLLANYTLNFIILVYIILAKINYDTTSILTTIVP